ncbi:hypothetical protein EYF80_051172 [Liparis tanakae]|uniref:Uncharacterized protein n=1 Tax=Liparis tanakae TaxID=230148 RepID=A0A4Z2FCL3_9TELE|nr:hypothetical protein EYF80_051172 [Liparis tanakae]
MCLFVLIFIRRVCGSQAPEPIGYDLQAAVQSVTSHEDTPCGPDRRKPTGNHTLLLHGHID